MSCFKMGLSVYHGFVAIAARLYFSDFGREKEFGLLGARRGLRGGRSRG